MSTNPDRRSRAPEAGGRVNMPGRADEPGTLRPGGPATAPFPEGNNAPAGPHTPPNAAGQAPADQPTRFLDWASRQPDRTALVVYGSGGPGPDSASGRRRSWTFGELADRAGRLGAALRDGGARPGDVVAVLLENRVEFIEAALATSLAGLYLVPVNWHLTAAEVRYILADSAASVLIASADLAEAALGALGGKARPARLVSVGGPIEGFTPYEELLASATPRDLGPAEGMEMIYSSGTTGRPKGIRRPISDGPSEVHRLATYHFRARFGLSGRDVIGVTTPLYHAYGLVVAMTGLRIGATVTMLERFDPATLLDMISRERVTYAGLVPTMFVRLLRLPDEVRTAADVSSLRIALHTAAPCPVHIKRRMMQWWGPVLYESYSGTEAVATADIGPHEWLAHPGSVGRPSRPVHVLDDDGRELGPGEAGHIYFETDSTFEYHGDPDRRASVTSQQGWVTMGDIGYVDEDGYLYLTDRSAFTIVSGGVNIYPREIEDRLLEHPYVADAAVFGVPDDEFGQSVHAVIEPAPGAPANDEELFAALRAHCREALAGYKCPRTWETSPSLPRDDNGKLYKRRLQEAHWQGRATRVV